MGVLSASVSAGERGPLITLSGESDPTARPALDELVSKPLADGTLWLTIDVAGLSLADTATIRVLIIAANKLRQRGGQLVVLHPQPLVAKSLEILGADQFMTISGGAWPRP